jgi:hypothetical protein
MKFTPTPAAINAVEQLILAMAHLDTTKPIVTAYKQEILNSRQWPVAEKMLELKQKRSPGTTPAHFVTDPELDYTIEESLWPEYHALVFAARDAAGLSIEGKPEACPVSYAQMALFAAQKALIESMQGKSPITLKEWLSTTPTLQKEAIDLTLKLLVPFFSKTPKSITIQ